MEQPDNDEILQNLAIACGQAFGFALCAAMQNPGQLRTRDSIGLLHDDLLAALQDGRSQYDAGFGLVMTGICTGLRDYADANPPC